MSPRRKHTDDELTELTYMDTDRVDLVKHAANGYDFILAKSAADDSSMFTPAEVADLAKTAQEGNMTDTAALAKDALDPDTLLEEPDVDAAGDAADPGSAAWEAVDAARAQQAIELTVALKRLVSVAAEREGQEAVVGDDPQDVENVWDLGDVLDQIDCILGVLAPFAVNEQVESEDRESDDASTTSSLVLKSGRALSGANESHIRQAQELLTTVLNTLPAAVEEVVKSKPEEAAVTDTATEPIEKAENEAVLVYDANGKVIGSVKATAITTFAATPSAAAADAEAAAPADAPAADDTAAPEGAAAPTDTAAAPAAAPAATADDGTVIPGTNTVQSPAPAAADDDTVKKSTEDIVKSTLEELLAPLAEKVASLGDIGAVVKGLQESVETMGRRPDDRRSPMLNGARGVAGLAVRGNEGVSEELVKAVEEATNDEALKKAKANLAFAAIKDRFVS